MKFNTFELLSAFQKSVRRGLEDDALYWGVQLYRNTNQEAGMAFNRLVVMASEDIGLADPQAALLIHSLHNFWRNMPKDKRWPDKIQGEGRLYFVHAVLVAVRAKKSRMVDNILITYFNAPRDSRDIPDYALDKHTSRGKAMGRGVDHFFEEGAKLANEDTSLGDVYKEAAKQVLS
jgi:replication-associated recombination protein RarA